jgi:hypothetical protein
MEKMIIKQEHPWHEDIIKRIEKGKVAQTEFELYWLCGCGGVFGGKFIRISNNHDPDYKCELCGRLVEVKASKLRDDLTIAISKIPFDKMNAETTIVWRYDIDKWSGILRKNARIFGGPFPPTHSGPHSTDWYTIDTMNFVSLGSLGFIHHKRTDL